MCRICVIWGVRLLMVSRRGPAISEKVSSELD